MGGRTIGKRNHSLCRTLLLPHCLLPIAPRCFNSPVPTTCSARICVRCFVDPPCHCSSPLRLFSLDFASTLTSTSHAASRAPSSTCSALSIGEFRSGDGIVPERLVCKDVKRCCGSERRRQGVDRTASRTSSARAISVDNVGSKRRPRVSARKRAMREWRDAMRVIRVSDGGGWRRLDRFCRVYLSCRGMLVSSRLFIARSIWAWARRLLC